MSIASLLDADSAAAAAALRLLANSLSTSSVTTLLRPRSWGGSRALLMPLPLGPASTLWGLCCDEEARAALAWPCCGLTPWAWTRGRLAVVEEGPLYVLHGKRRRTGQRSAHAFVLVLSFGWDPRWDLFTSPHHQWPNREGAE